MRSRLPKVLHPVCGVPMLGYVIDAARSATGRRPLVIISPVTEQVRAVFTDRADFAVQEEPRGTGDAVRAALAAVPQGVTEVVVLSGDVPLLTADLVTALWRSAERRTRWSRSCPSTPSIPPASGAWSATRTVR